MITVAFEDILGEENVSKLSEQEIDVLLEEFIQMAENEPNLEVRRFDK